MGGGRAAKAVVSVRAMRRYTGGALLGRTTIEVAARSTKTFLVENADSKEYGKFLQLAVAKRPAEELFDVKKDPANLVNLADKPEFAEVLKRLRGELEQYLKETKDPRVLGKGDVWESYPRYSPIRK